MKLLQNFMETASFGDDSAMPRVQGLLYEPGATLQMSEELNNIIANESNARTARVTKEEMLVAIPESWQASVKQHNAAVKNLVFPTNPPVVIPSDFRILFT
jgi:hypothetical protein